MTLVILLMIALGLFGIAFLTKRRFGVLGLGLTAGLVLSREIAKETAAFLQYIDFPVAPLSHLTVATLLLILMPALVLLVSGPKYSDQRLAAVGSIAFALFGTMLLLGPLTMSLPLTDRAIQPTISMIALNSPLIISVGVVAAIFDMMQAQGKQPFAKKAKH